MWCTDILIKMGLPKLKLNNETKNNLYVFNVEYAQINQQSIFLGQLIVTYKIRFCWVEQRVVEEICCVLSNTTVEWEGSGGTKPVYAWAHVSPKWTLSTSNNCNWTSLEAALWVCKSHSQSLSQHHGTYRGVSGPPIT